MKCVGISLVLLVMLCVAVLPAGAQSGGGADALPGWKLTGYLNLDRVGDLFRMQIDPLTARLSPDGNHLAWNNRSDGTCSGQFDTLKVECFVWPEGLRPTDLSWAPSSDMLILHNDVVRYMLESDLWLLDLADGSYTNLTDDGVDKVLGNESGAARSHAHLGSVYRRPVFLPYSAP